MFAWYQTFGGKLDVSNVSEITKTASITGLLRAPGLVGLEFAEVMNTDSIDPLRAMSAVLMPSLK